MARGRYFIEMRHREFFDSAEDREHYLKTHSPIPYDDITGLLKNGSVTHAEKDDDGGEQEIVISLKRSNGGDK